MMKEVLTSLKHLPTPPGLHPQVSQYHSLTITSLTNPEYTPRTKKLVKYDPGFIFKFYKLENGQEHPCRSCMLKSDTIVPKNVKNSQLGTVFRLPKTVKTLMLKSSVSSTKYKKALGNEIAGASDNKVPINSSVRKLMTSEGRCTRRVITDKVSSARCGTCRQLVVNPDTVRYKSPPQGAVEEFTEMSDPKVLHFEGGDFAGEDSMPQYKLTGCTLYNRVLLDDDSDLTVELKPWLILLPRMRAIIKLASVKLMERKKLSIEQNKSIPKYTSARVTPLVIIQSSSSQLFSCTIFYIAGQGSV